MNSKETIQLMSEPHTSINHQEMNSEIDLLRGENLKQQEEIERLKIFLAELETTNNHLVSATWREREMKKQLTKTLGELNDTQKLVEEQHRRINESINYAQRIQQSINVSEDELKTVFPESFIIYKPKDSISGDFPWFYKHENFVWVAAVDCTGHGVPGAMLSMIGNLLLHDIVNDSDTPEPSEILNKLHSSIVRTLKQGAASANSSDGMDIALCRYNTQTNELLFAGSHRPLLISTKGEITLVAGDKFPIGGINYKNRSDYSNHSFTLTKGDYFLLYSDGYSDQFGGSNNKRITNKGIKQLLEESAFTDMQQMRGKIDSFFIEWKGNNTQIDDVVIIGIQI
ncbi:MAG: PP2C family protein-serine/threonine phosphatase [Bacteroidia bacterium]